jgi:hypothetical protein
MISAALAALAALALSTPVDAAPIKPVSASASSTLPGEPGVSYAAANAMDRKQSTVWVEGDTAGNGLGTTLEFDLGGTYTVTELHVWNGNWYTFDFWNRHNRVKELIITFSDGSKETHVLKDEMVMQVLKLKKPVSTSSVTLKINQVYRGTTFPDTVISEVVIYDDQPSNVVTPVAFRDSSHLEADADGSYEASNVGDLVLDSMWCEAASGNGLGEWIEIDFGKPVQITKMSLVNGNAYGLSYWMKSNRVTGLELSFSNGSTQTVTVKNVMLPQLIALEPVTTTKVKLKVTGVHPGKDAATDEAYDCVCISEAAFLR